MYGFTGRILHVDLSRGSLTIEEPNEAFYRKYLGGSALGMSYILRDVPARADPLGSDNILTFTVGPLAGTPISGQSRISVNGRSPLGGAIGDSQMGGSFPAVLKFAGFDAVILRGRSPAPVYLWIDDGRAELRDASHLWGKITGDAEQAIRDEHDDQQIEVAQCGPAGERLIRYAAIINMRNRAAGRTGMGAVMGSKKLKAIAVRGTDKQRIRIWDPDRFRELTRAGTEGVQASAAMLSLQKYGTAGALARNQALGGLPTHNWADGELERHDRITGETMHDTLLLRNDTCYACAVRCKRAVQNERAGIKPEYGGPEYETLATFGAYCGVTDLETLALANQICNQNGLDTITTGATIAFAMDCFEHHVINGTMTDGVELEFGVPDAMLWALDRIVHREGIGDVLANGTDYAAKVWGKGAEELATTVKGSNLPAHMPQVKRSLGLIYAVNPFGADHQSSQHDPAYAPDSGEEEQRRLSLLGLDEQLDSTDLSEGKVRFAWETQKFYSALDSASVCQFVYGPSYQLYGPDHLVQAINAVTGWDLTIEEIQEIGERRLTMMRAFNAREGIDRQDDKLPKKLFKPLQKGRNKGTKLSEEEMETALDSYYRMAGWDVETGTPGQDVFHRLGIDVTE